MNESEQPPPAIPSEEPSKETPDEHITLQDVQAAQDFAQEFVNLHLRLQHELDERRAPARSAYASQDLYMNAIAQWRDSLDEILRLHLFTCMAAAVRLLL
jgi:hypothetical protein